MLLFLMRVLVGLPREIPSAILTIVPNPVMLVSPMFVVIRNGAEVPFAVSAEYTTCIGRTFSEQVSFQSDVF
jgi:hypothetical protein